ncbi:hypothetical protein K438DRAFT_1740303 [Mycena galopus ATCC 62051]|nr:hypothetical protein K438DRAFT_1740303 [Mycena galopus ATCC 62051]
MSSSELERINDIAYYVAPQTSNGDPKDPQIILVFGWFGARLSHLVKYCAKYSELYPAASQLIIQSDMVWGAWESRAAYTNRQRPILEKLAQLGLFGPTPPRLLIHVLSNGGAAQLLWLGLALQSRLCRDTQPLTCLVIDSSPGSVLHADVQAGLTSSLTGSKRLVGLAVASLIYFGLWTKSTISGRPTIHDFMRNGLSNPRILPWMDSSTQRLYLYSDADQTTLVGDVKEHIEAAKEKGLNIREEYFLGSDHVQHSKKYPERYWGAVCSTWHDVVRSKL